MYKRRLVGSVLWAHVFISLNQLCFLNFLCSDIHYSTSSSKRYINKVCCCPCFLIYYLLYKPKQFVFIFPFTQYIPVITRYRNLEKQRVRACTWFQGTLKSTERPRATFISPNCNDLKVVWSKVVAEASTNTILSSSMIHCSLYMHQSLPVDYKEDPDG